jgi:hypothetical protein
LAVALRQAYSTLAPALAQRFRAEEARNRSHDSPEPQKPQQIQLDNGHGSGVPAVPGEFGSTPQRAAEDIAADASAEWEERAAIREYDGHMSRGEAERLTALELGPRPQGAT